MTEEEKKLRNNAACKRWREKNRDYDKQRQKEYWAANPEKRREKNNRWREDNIERARELARQAYQRNKDNDAPFRKKEYKLYWSAKQRALKKNLPFDLRVTDIVIPEVCPCCHKRIVRPSVDRVVPSLGYIKSNINLICYICNQVKSSGDSRLHRLIADYIDQYTQ